MLVALVALGGVLYSNWRTTVNIERAAAAARESRRLERHEDRISDSYIRIEVARRALYDVLNDTVWDGGPGSLRPEVPDTHEEIRTRFEAMRSAHAEGSLYVTKEVGRHISRLHHVIPDVARSIEVLKNREDEDSLHEVLDKVTNALHELSRLRIQMRIEIGSAEPEEMY